MISQNISSVNIKINEEVQMDNKNNESLINKSNVKSKSHF
jgi:hypothetical protein